MPGCALCFRSEVSRREAQVAMSISRPSLDYQGSLASTG
jgi:hypothetical protein